MESCFSTWVTYFPEERLNLDLSGVRKVASLVMAVNGARYNALPSVAPEAFQYHAMVFSVAPRRLIRMRYIRQQWP